MKKTLSVVGSILLAATALSWPAASAQEDPAADTAMMLVMDASGSMAERTGGGSTRIQAAKDGLDAVIDGLPDEQRVGFRVYGASDVAEDDPAACTDSERIVDLDTDNRDALRQAVADYEPVGWTPTSHALREAAKDLGDSGQRTIVLVSDGEPTCDPDPCVVAREIAKDGIDIRIDVVGFDVSGGARKTLQCVADEGNGTYYDADDAESLTDSLRVSSVRASRPFDLTGTPVKGTPTEDGAPLLAPGQYTDTVAVGGPSNYRVARTAPDSTVHVGAVISGVSGDLGASATLRTKRIGGLMCSGSTTYGLDMSSRSPVYYGGVSSWVRDADSECRTDDELGVQVERSVGQIEGRPIELAVYEEPPITSELAPGAAGGEPEWVAPTPGTATEAVPGTSIASAPEVGPGTYQLDISAGETQVLAVPVDWGEQVRAQVDAKLNDEVRDAAAIGSGLDVSVINPLRRDVTISLYGNWPQDWTRDPWANLRENIAFRTGAMSWPLHPANRAQNDTTREGASLAGMHYVVVSLKLRGDETNLPYTLTLDRENVLGDVAPTYADVDGLTAPVADSRLVDSPVTAAAEKTDDADTRAAAGAEDSASLLPWVVGGAVAALVLAAGIVMVLRRRR
ncbi:VWA domain-containing protein [Aeromicrobium sp. Marseille-Q0843]|uniref:VWA domain-containing protein n=1 Tax=Aeromicrobium phoceense TaxID=2754045 RepID=A0A838XDT8_9ACTN|nr:VWA domain-containing protein [Aeromicrobium phoceense]MBA4606958.1 VWA domain-containing protein [Aeromicrobium phoceense]